MKKTLLMVAMLVCGMTAFAEDVTYAPAMDVNFRAAAGGEAWQTVKNAADEGNNDFELTYAAGFFSLQKFTVADLQNVSKLVLTLTVGSRNGVDAVEVWPFANNDWTADSEAAAIVGLVTSTVGVAPRVAEGEANTPLAKGAKVKDSDPAKATFTISGAALATLKAGATADGTFTLLLTNNKYIDANSKRSYLSNNSANDEANRPSLVATVATPVVVNVTTGVGYTSMNEAFTALTGDAHLVINDDIKLTDRCTLSEAYNVTITASKDVTVKGQKNKMWFLVNKSNGSLSIGSSEHKITFDGIEDDRSSFNNVDVTRRENSSKLYLTNIEFKDFNCGANHLVGCKNAGGGIYLEDVTFTNCSSTDALISNLREQNDALCLKGYLNQSGCTGTTIYTAKNRIRLGDPENNSIYGEFSANSDITIAWGGDVAEGTNVVVKVPGSAADKFKLVGHDGWWLARKASNGDMYMTQKDEAPTSGIAEMMNGTSAGGPCFTLGGRRVGQPQKGLYIVGGKKVVMK